MELTEARKAWVVPWKLQVMPLGMDLPVISLTVSTACPSETPPLRLKEMVTETCWPEWLICSGPTPSVMFTNAFIGTNWPWEERT